jgi:hypothetical protein
LSERRRDLLHVDEVDVIVRSVVAAVLAEHHGRADRDVADERVGFVEEVMRIAAPRIVLPGLIEIAVAAVRPGVPRSDREARAEGAVHVDAQGRPEIGAAVGNRIAHDDGVARRRIRKLHEVTDVREAHGATP